MELQSNVSAKLDKTIIVIAGPTAVGKSHIAMQLAQKFDTEILSADARQCFIEMNIGTAKPSREELDLIPHYFINSHSINDKMSVGIYERYALSTLDEIFSRKNVAIVVGGTGLYINALINGIDEMPPTEDAIAKEVNNLFLSKGIEGLVNSIKTEDPVYYSNGLLDNPSRMIRALSFIRSNGTSILNYKKGENAKRSFNTIGIGIGMDRAALNKRINERVDKMMDSGLYEEAVALFPYRDNYNLKTVGYQEFYIDDNLATSKEDIAMAVEKIKQHSRNYAKRQSTWFRNKCNLTWYQPDDIEKIISDLYSNDFLN